MTLTPAPLRDVVVQTPKFVQTEPMVGKLTPPWERWFAFLFDVVNTIDAALTALTATVATISSTLSALVTTVTTLSSVVPKKVGGVTLTAQAAAIASTAVPTTVALAAGTHRVSVYLRQTQAATTSAALRVDITHTDGGVLCTRTGATVSSNTTATVSEAHYTVRCDAASTINYVVSYASVGATAAQYRLDVELEQLP